MSILNNLRCLSTPSCFLKASNLAARLSVFILVHLWEVAGESGHRLDFLGILPALVQVLAQVQLPLPQKLLVLLRLPELGRSLINCGCGTTVIHVLVVP